MSSKSWECMLPDDLAGIDLNNKIALKQPLIKTEQNNLTFKLSGNTIKDFDFILIHLDSL